jgi:hypothetical protein
MDMGHITIKPVVIDDPTPDPVASPTTSDLAHTTSYRDVLAGYVEVIARLSTSTHRGPAPPAR